MSLGFWLQETVKQMIARRARLRAKHSYLWKADIGDPLQPKKWELAVNKWNEKLDVLAKEISQLDRDIVEMQAMASVYADRG